MRLELEFDPNAPVATLDEPANFDSHAVDEPSVLVKGGIAAAQKGDREKARDLLARAAKADPQSEDAWMWLASISDYPEELLAFLDRVLEINPENLRAVEWHAATRSLLAKTFVQRGIAAHNEGSADSARSCFDRALDHDDRCAPAWFWKASVATSDDEKIKCLDRALELDPSNDEARQALASLKAPTPEATLEEAKWAAVAGKRKKALEILDEVLANGHSTAEGWVLRSHLSLSLSDKLESLERALELDPGDQSARASYDFLTATIRDAHSPDDQPVEQNEPVDLVNETTPAPADAVPSEGRSIEEIFGSQVEDIGPDNLTVESFAASQFGEPVDDVPAADDSAEVYESVPAETELGGRAAEYEVIDATEIVAEANEASETVVTAVCAFCNAQVESQAFKCANCHAVLTLSDLESLLANSDADRDAIQQAITQMEAEWNSREFSVDELAVLGVGHFNLRSFDKGLKYLQEASRLDPNNVILAGQVNALAIRLEEMRRQDEIDESKPRGKTILVVDDSPTVRKLISAKLEKSGHYVTCAVDGVEGLEKLESGLPDLVLLDIAMPRLDGYEVCKQIRSNPAAAELPVVMISGRDGFFDKVRGKMAGCTGYITKPFGPETLMKALETYLLPENGHHE
jgi:CheY-like chemotaxis protein